MASLFIFILVIVLAALRVEWRVTWVVSAIVIALATLFGAIPWLGFIVWTLATLIFTLDSYRADLISAPFLQLAGKMLPRLSDTEREAVEAGMVGLEAELLSGAPRWQKYFDLKIQLTDEEQQFIDGPVTEVCQMVDDWNVTHERADLSPEVWDYLKVNGFFGLIIAKEHGGKGFSAAAHSEVLVNLYSVSATLGVTVAVPNSLGPGELLHRYGTSEQKDYYLPRLARGEEVPCFALTTPDAGSDASAILDEGIVCERKKIDGQVVVGISLTFDKRYITLAPVATLIGLAFKLKDPEHLLGDVEDVGVTCALLPRDTPGVTIGRRHFPLNVPFQNGPIQGEDVFIPLDAIIGGAKCAGQGWRMLVECLSAGRGISLPSGSTGSAKLAVLASGAYSRIRHQFGMPIAEMQGIKDSIARQVCNTVIMDATRRLVAAEIDSGITSGVAAAIVKYHVTELGRQVLLDAMDVHGGKAIMLGPSNYLARAYQAAPIAITVEGANILTRSLMIFGQGAIRCHPYLLREMAAIEQQSVDEFDSALLAHAGWSVTNACRAFVLAIWCGISYRLFPRIFPESGYQLDMERFSASLATLTDFALLRFGGGLKREQSLGARLGDLLSIQYLAASVFTDRTYDYRSDQYAVTFDYVMQRLLQDSDRALAQFIRNVPDWPSRFLLSVALRPMFSTYNGPKDSLGHELADLVTLPTTFRDNLTRSVASAEGTVLGELNQALTDLLAVEPVIKTLQQELGLPSQYRRIDVLAKQGLARNLIDQDQYDLLIRAANGRLATISVDDFAPEQLSRPEVGEVHSAIWDQESSL